MPFTVDIRSKENILGQLIRAYRVGPNGEANDIAPGSSLATTLEALAAAIAQTEVSSLKILENTNLEKLIGTALDEKAASLKLPNGVGGIGRKPANPASGKIKIGSSFSKISSKLYAGKPAPFSGATYIYVEDASLFPTSPTGSVYLGRGTVDRFEGPIPYSAITNNGSFWTITLSSPLTKSHLHSDLVVLSQGGDRTVGAGTVVQVPANSQTPAVSFTTNQDLVIADGEAEEEVAVTCTEFGENGNALAGAINQFSSAPFSGATVTNPNSFKNGKSSENDEDLRQRIKTYPSTLSKGTKGAILAAITGLSDPTSGRTIQSASIVEPLEPGDFARGYIDDSTGLEPAFDSQAYELLLQSSSGLETRFRTAKFPITPAVAEGANFAPYVLREGLTLKIKVDDIVETYTITPSNYKNINSATTYEIVRDLNFQSNICGFRTIDDGKRIVAMDLSGNAETLQIESGDWQEIIGFPVATIRPIFVYKDSKLQSFRGHTASLETRARSEWNITAFDLANVRVKVDGVIQTISITDADFAEFSSNIASASISHWATVFSRKIAGVKFTVSGQVLIWSTYQTFSSGGSIEILETKGDGSVAGWVGDTKIWKPITSGGILSDVGFSKNYKLNRFTGELNFIEKPDVGDSIEIGSRTTRAFIKSKTTPSGLFGLSQLPTTVGNSRLIVGFDGEFSLRSITVGPGSQFTPSIPDPSGASNIIRLTANNADLFKNIEVGDWIYLAKDVATVPAWASNVEGFYRAKLIGNNVYSTNQVFNTLSASTTVDLNVQVSTTIGSSYVKVTKTNHGLQDGDKIIVITASAVGGIPNTNLSTTSFPITILDQNNFLYNTGFLATSSATGLLDTIGYNIISVTHTNHGFLSGGYINVSTGAALGGISAVDLSVTSSPVTVIDNNTYQYRAANTALSVPSSATGTLTTLTYLADAWIEFEVSTVQLTDWTPLLTVAQNSSQLMLYAFRSSSFPQLVDFGVGGSMTADAVVSLINSNIIGGTAVKLSPQQISLRSNDFINGTIAIFATIGNASNLFSTEISGSRQSHTGNSQSGYIQNGAPVFSQVVLPTSPTSGYPTRTYLAIDKSLTNINDTNINPGIDTITAGNYPEGFQHMWLTGRMSGLTSRVYNNQGSSPFTGILRGEGMLKPLGTADIEQTTPDTLNRYANYGLRFRDASMNNHNKLVVEMDLNPTDKTVVVPMYKIAKIMDIDNLTGSGFAGQVISFRLKDSEDSDKPFFDSTSVYKDFDFEDFKILTRSVGLYKDAGGRALVIRSTDFGGSHRLRLSIRFPTEPDQSDFILSHFNDFDNNETRLNLIAVLPSQSVILGTLYNSGNFNLTTSLSGSLWDWRITGGILNSGSNYAPGQVFNIGGNSEISGSYEITSASYITLSNKTATTTLSSFTVNVNSIGHGLQTGDLINITTSAAIGGISSANLSVIDSPITVVDANNFTFEALTQATSGASGSIDTINLGLILVKAPGSPGIPASTPTLFNAALNPLSAWNLLNKSWAELATAINSYYPDNQVATAEALGSSLSLFPIARPTYAVYPALAPYTGDSNSAAFNVHSFSAKLSGSAGIWQYDSSNPLVNNIKATVQTNDSIFPTVSDAIGTTYNPIDEEVYIVPTNTKTIDAWSRFKAVSSLNLITSSERIQSDDLLQFSSREDGSSGAVRITGVAANKVSTTVIGNATEIENSTKISILSAEAKTLSRHSLVTLTNTVSSEKLRPYRFDMSAPVSQPNTSNINNYFRPTNSIKYIRTGTNTGRLIFFRNGQGIGQVEPALPGDTITTINLGNGLVQLSSTGILSARIGDMMYIPTQSSPFSNDFCCKEVSSSGITDGLKPEYLGYPVVYTPDSSTVIVLAPNIGTFSSVVLTDSRDIVFMPAIWNEKNIQTNHQPGVKFDELYNKAYYLLKQVGPGLMSLWVQNASTELLDTMRLNHMSVSIDDKIILGSGFDPANQGSFQIIGHNGKNHVLFYNPNGGKDEIIDTDALSNGGNGDRKWRIGPLDAGVERSIRVVASESVSIGDYLRISSPSSPTQWFNNSFFGSWKVSGIGYIAKNYSEGSVLAAQANNGSPIINVTHPSHGYTTGDTLTFVVGTGFGGLSSATLSGSFQITVVDGNSYYYSVISLATSTAAGVIDSVMTLPSTTSSGTFDAREICPYIDFEIPNAPISVVNSLGDSVDRFLIGSNDDAIGFTEGAPFNVFRLVAGHAVSELNPEESDLFLVPKLNSSKFSDVFGTIVQAVHKIGFKEQTFQGIDGFKSFGDLILQAHRVVDGLPQNTTLYPGVKAAGTFIEFLPPLFKSISISLKVLPKDGVTINSISEVVKSSVESYVNNLGNGSPVILSEIIRVVQSLPGVLSVQILETLPVADEDRIVVSEAEKAKILDASSDVIIG